LTPRILIVDELLFYRNKIGAVAISVDDGETVWIPSGRNLPLTLAWEWTDEPGLETLLTPQQNKVLEEAKNAPPLTEIEKMAEDLRKRQRDAQKDYFQPPPPHRRVRESVLVVTSDPDD